ncbi:hypothetical protein KUCAC02_027121 [Chaenocephalus aceratus]|uniref:Uncharacterized protein n=1 Tax=Chaenocephalus aceratus TaxID=36190 RepID=A0ACB9W3G2_CHAAC|nr:hypothetical protein KUCAC02_027121 [Chaenocephalus aceratus]
MMCVSSDLSLLPQVPSAYASVVEQTAKANQLTTMNSRLRLHSDSDWISAHPEEHQDFDSFYRDPSRKTPNASHNTIYIQTIGSFGEAGAQTDQCVEWLREYCQAFFYGLSVKLLPAVTVAETKCSFRVNSDSHNLQILTGDLLQFLRSRKPADAFCIVGITMIDLYPKDSWNFVFGQASLSNGMGVFSFSSSLLLRPCKKMTHEIGHMFGLKHCQWLSCGSNHLEESDRRPLDFCPVCLRKLQVAIGFKIADRYKMFLSGLSAPEESSTCQSLLHFPKPTEAFQTSRLWLHRCLDILRE